MSEESDDNLSVLPTPNFILHEPQNKIFKFG